MQTAQAIRIEKKPVSHRWQGRGGYMPIAIVEHMMQGTLERSWQFFDGKTEEVYQKSAHYGIGRDGRIWQFVEDEDTAWSNGILQQPDRSVEWIDEVVQENVNCNLVTLSVEYEGFSGQALSEAQYDSALALHRQLIKRWEIEPNDQHIIGHNRLDSVERGHNPGPAFPWSRLLYDLARPAPVTGDLPTTVDSEVGRAAVAPAPAPVTLAPEPETDALTTTSQTETPVTGSDSETTMAQSTEEVETPAAGLPLAAEIFSLPQTAPLTEPEIHEPTTETTAHPIQTAETINTAAQAESEGFLPDWLATDEVTASLTPDFADIEAAPAPAFAQDTVATELKVETVDDTVPPPALPDEAAEPVTDQPTSVLVLDSQDGLTTEAQQAVGRAGSLMAEPQSDPSDLAMGEATQAAPVNKPTSFNLFDDDELPTPFGLDDQPEESDAAKPASSGFNFLTDDLPSFESATTFQPTEATTPAPPPAFNFLEDDLPPLPFDLTETDAAQAAPSFGEPETAQPFNLFDDEALPTPEGFDAQIEQPAEAVKPALAYELLEEGEIPASSNMSTTTEPTSFSTSSLFEEATDDAPPTFNLFEEGEKAHPATFSTFEDDLPPPPSLFEETGPATNYAEENQPISLSEISEQGPGGLNLPDQTDSYPISLDEIAQQAQQQTAPATKPVTEPLRPAGNLYPFELPSEPEPAQATEPDEKEAVFNYPFELPGDGQAASAATYQEPAVNPGVSELSDSGSLYPFDLPPEPAQPAPWPTQAQAQTSDDWLPDFLKDSPTPSFAAEAAQPVVEALPTAQPDWHTDLFEETPPDAAPTAPSRPFDPTQPPGGLATAFDSADPLDLYDEIAPPVSAETSKVDFTMPDDAALDLASLQPTAPTEDFSFQADAPVGQPHVFMPPKDAEAESETGLPEWMNEPLTGTGEPAAQPATETDLRDKATTQLPSLAEQPTQDTAQLPPVVDFDEADFNQFVTQPQPTLSSNPMPAPPSSPGFGAMPPAQPFFTPPTSPTANPYAVPASPSPTPAAESGAVNWSNIGGSTVSVDRANVRTRPTVEANTVQRVVNFGQRFLLDGWTQGPELRGSTLWFHVGQSDGGGWIHSTLVRLDRPFDPQRQG